MYAVYVYLFIHTYIYICVYINIYTYIGIYAYTAYTCIHAHIQYIHTCIFFLNLICCCRTLLYIFCTVQYMFCQHVVHWVYLCTGFDHNCCAVMMLANRQVEAAAACSLSVDMSPSACLSPYQSRLSTNVSTILTFSLQWWQTSIIIITHKLWLRLMEMLCVLRVFQHKPKNSLNI